VNGEAFPTWFPALKMPRSVSRRRFETLIGERHVGARFVQEAVGTTIVIWFHNEL